MTTPCLQEVNIALLSKTTTSMAEKIEKIENSVDSIKIELQKVKDFMGTMELSAQKNNSDIKEVINSNFAELRLNFEKEREQAIKDTKNRVKENFANKIAEKVIFWVITAIGVGLVGAILKLIIK